MLLIWFSLLSVNSKDLIRVWMQSKLMMLIDVGDFYLLLRFLLVAMVFLLQLGLFLSPVLFIVFVVFSNSIIHCVFGNGFLVAHYGDSDHFTVNLDMHFVMKMVGVEQYEYWNY